ncbi:MAG: hypothetical protein HQL05_15835 [Nitrospirae bacterium]|nr:hypothetical protein [Nitrospirota bacterium]
MKKAKQDKTMTLIHGNPTGRKNIGKKKKAGVVKVTEGALERERERESKNGAKIGISWHIGRHFIPLAH